jgi:uncharacterized membrane protein
MTSSILGCVVFLFLRNFTSSVGFFRTIVMIVSLIPSCVFGGVRI